MNTDFYSNFSTTLRIALQAGIVSFDGIDFEENFEPIIAFRGVFRNPGDSIGEITREDFCSQEEKGRKWRPILGKNRLFNFSCSMFTDVEELKLALKFPGCGDRHIISGKITKEAGGITREKQSSHIHWWLYKNCGSFYETFDEVI